MPTLPPAGSPSGAHVPWTMVGGQVAPGGPGAAAAGPYAGAAAGPGGVAYGGGGGGGSPSGFAQYQSQAAMMQRMAMQQVRVRGVGGCACRLSDAWHLVLLQSQPRSRLC